MRGLTAETKDPDGPRRRCQGIWQHSPPPEWRLRPVGQSLHCVPPTCTRILQWCNCLEIFHLRRSLPHPLPPPLGDLLFRIDLLP